MWKWSMTLEALRHVDNDAPWCRSVAAVGDLVGDAEVEETGTQ